MIVGSITQSNMADLLAHTRVLRRAIEWIRALPDDPADGITELDGRDLYANVHRYTTRSPQDCPWESHRLTADVQYLLEGGELIGWTPETPAGPSIDYDSAKDFEHWPDAIPSAQTIVMSPGTFVVYLPGELHRPMMSDGRNIAVRKVVVKIHARLLTPR